MKKFLLFFGIILTTVLNAQAQAPKSIYYNPSWSPDGKKIVFESTKDGKYAIYIIQANGSNLRK